MFFSIGCIMGLLLLSWQPDNLSEALLILLLIGLLCCIFYRLPLQSQVCCSPTLTLYQLVILNTKIIPILKFYLKSLSKLVLCFILFSLIRLIFFNFIKINSSHFFFHFIILFKLIRLIFLLLKFNLSYFIYILSYFPTFILINPSHFVLQTREIKHKNTDQCLEKPSTKDASTPQLQSCDGSPGQQWILKSKFYWQADS